MSRAPEAMQPAFQNVRRVFGPRRRRVVQFGDGQESSPASVPWPRPGTRPGHYGFLVSDGDDRLMVSSDTTNKPELFVRNPAWQAVSTWTASRPPRPACGCWTWRRRAAGGGGLPFPVPGHRPYRARRRRLRLRPDLLARFLAKRGHIAEGCARRRIQRRSWIDHACHRCSAAPAGGCLNELPDESTHRGEAATAPSAGEPVSGNRGGATPPANSSNSSRRSTARSSCRAMPTTLRPAGKPIPPSSADQRLVVYCETPGDVRQSLGFARRLGLAVRCRSGGHSTAGFSVADGCMIIDTSRMQYVHVSADARHASRTCRRRQRLGLRQLGARQLRPARARRRLRERLRRRLHAGRRLWLHLAHVRHELRQRHRGEGDAGRRSDRQSGRAAATYPLFWAVRGGTGGNFGVLLDISYRLHRTGPLWGFGAPLGNRATPHRRSWRSRTAT